MNLADFVADTEKCAGCGKCVNVCPGEYSNASEPPFIA